MALAYSLVSVVIPVLNEERVIRDCILSLINSSFPNEKMEILVIDGGSSDNTVSEVESIAREFPQIRLFHNPRRNVSAAMNIGSREAGGDILIGVDPQGIYNKDYISYSVENLIALEAAGVGGQVTTVGKNFLSRAIAAALATPLGTGGTNWQFGTSAKWVETLWCGCYWKKDFFRIGGFNEDWKHDQDTEFNIRMNELTGKLYYDPKIKSTRFAQSRISDFLKQYFCFGWWRGKTLIRYPTSLRLRHILPVLFLVSIIAIVLLFSHQHLLLTGLGVIYALIMAIAVVLSGKFQFETLVVPLVLLLIHTTWVTGLLMSLICHPFRGFPKNA